MRARSSKRHDGTVSSYQKTGKHFVADVAEPLNGIRPSAASMDKFKEELLQDSADLARAAEQCKAEEELLFSSLKKKVVFNEDDDDEE